LYQGPSWESSEALPFKLSASDEYLINRLASEFTFEAPAIQQEEPALPTSFFTPDLSSTTAFDFGAFPLFGDDPFSGPATSGFEAGDVGPPFGGF